MGFIYLLGSLITGGLLGINDKVGGGDFSLFLGLKIL